MGYEDGTTDSVLGSIRSGTPDWAAVFERYFTVMYAAANSVLGGEAALGVDADDVVAIAFREVMRTGFPPDVRQPHSYLANVCRRRAVDQLRRRRLQDDAPADDDTRPVAGSTGPEIPEDVVTRAETAAEITAQLDELPQRHRVALVEYRMKQRPRREVAEELGVSEQRVSQLVGEAVAKLAKLPAFAPGGPLDPRGGSMETAPEGGLSR